MKETLLLNGYITFLQIILYFKTMSRLINRMVFTSFSNNYELWKYEPAVYTRTSQIFYVYFHLSVWSIPQMKHMMQSLSQLSNTHNER